MTQAEEETREKKNSFNVLETSENYNGAKSSGAVLHVERSDINLWLCDTSLLSSAKGTPQ